MTKEEKAARDKELDEMLQGSANILIGFSLKYKAGDMTYEEFTKEVVELAGHVALLLGIEKVEETGMQMHDCDDCILRTTVFKMDAIWAEASKCPSFERASKKRKSKRQREDEMKDKMPPVIGREVSA